MLRDAVRGVTVVAVELAEEAGKRVVGAATGLLERSGVDVAALERTVAEQFPPSVHSLQTLAEEAVTVGRAGLDLALGAARSEAEKIFEMVGDQVTKVGVVLGYLESKLREVEEQQVEERPARSESRAGGLFEAGWEDEPAPEPVPEPAPAAPAEAVQAAEPVPAKKAAPAEKPAPAKKKPATKKTAAKKAVPTQKAAPARKPAPRKKAAPAKDSDV